MIYISKGQHCADFEQEKSEHHAIGLGNVGQEKSETQAMSSERRQAENEDTLLLAHCRATQSLHVSIHKLY